MQYAFFALLIALEAVQQGVICWCLREFVPEEYNGVRLAKYTGFALHFVGVASYLVVVAWVGYKAHLLVNVEFWLLALLLRVLLFDVSLNLTKNYMNRLFGRDKEPLFSIGTSSLTDAVVQWVGKRTGWNATLVSGALRVAAAVVVVALLVV